MKSWKMLTSGGGLLALVLFGMQAFAQVTVLDTGFYSQDSGGFTSVSDAQLGGLSLAGASKLVVTIGVKGGSYPVSASYNGQPMILAVGQADLDNLGWTGVFYLDQPAGAGDLVFSSGGYSGGVSAVVLGGTEAGMGPSASAQARMTTVTTLTDGAIVVAAYSGSNGVAPGALGDLIEILNVYDLYANHSAGSGTYVSAYRFLPTAGSLITVFDSSASASRQAVVAVAFPPPPPPAGTVVVLY